MNGDAFARYFDSQYESYDDDVPLWIELARSSPGRVLELGCGTGRVLRALAANDIAVTGIDSDPAMLQRAENNLFPRFQSSVQLSNQDIREFTLGDSFSLILAICNVIAQLPLPQARKVFERALTHLQPGGVLAIDLPNPENALEPTLSPEAELVADFLDIDSNHPVQVYASYAPGSTIEQQEVIWHYDELFPDGRVSRLEVPVTYYLRSQDEIRTELEDVGFESIEFRQGYTSAPLLGTLSRQVVVASAP